MKKNLMPIIAILMAVLTIASCSSLAKQTMKHGTGTPLGTVLADVTLTKNRAGRITGDTGKYGYFDKMSATLPRKLKGTGRNTAQEGSSANPTLAEKAYAVAAYEIIQQIKAKGGNAVANVVSNVDKNYDPDTRIETVRVIITAEAIKRQ